MTCGMVFWLICMFLFSMSRGFSPQREVEEE